MCIDHFISNSLTKQNVLFIKELASSKQLEKITLTVNKNNLHSIASYEKMGFKITDDVCTNIGESYVMDDYTMALKI